MICEFGYKRPTINCEGGSLINIKSVFWGRKKGEKRCISNFYKDVSECKQTPSQAEKGLKTIQNKCNKNQKCDFGPLKWLLGDPCQKVSKYLNIKYDCIRKGKYINTF